MEDGDDKVESSTEVSSDAVAQYDRISDLNNRVDELKRELGALKKKLHKAEFERDSAQRNAENLKREVRELSKKLQEERKKTAESRRENSDALQNCKDIRGSLLWVLSVNSSICVIFFWGERGGGGGGESSVINYWIKCCLDLNTWCRFVALRVNCPSSKWASTPRHVCICTIVPFNAPIVDPPRFYFLDWTKTYPICRV